MDTSPETWIDPGKFASHLPGGLDSLADAKVDDDPSEQ